MPFVHWSAPSLALSSSRSAPDWLNLAFCVLPISMTSGGLLPASAVVSLSWMPFHCCTSTVTVVPGCLAARSVLTAWTTGSGTDPSISQTVRAFFSEAPEPLGASSPPHALSERARPMAAASAGAVHRCFTTSS